MLKDPAGVVVCDGDNHQLVQLLPLLKDATADDIVVHVGNGDGDDENGCFINSTTCLRILMLLPGRAGKL